MKEKSLLLCLLGIFLFNEFQVNDMSITFSNNKQEKRDALKYFLRLLNQIVEEEFYLIQSPDNSIMKLFCHSNPFFFSKMFEELVKKVENIWEEI
jgi:hypothetical protein